MNSNYLPENLTARAPFLATTAAKKFWDTSGELIYLGPWCRIYDWRNPSDESNIVTLPDPYKNIKFEEMGFADVDNLYVKVLPVISAALNELHGVNYSDRFWRILVGPWLQLYLPVVFDRWLHIQSALTELPNFNTIGLAEAAHVTPKDTLEAACLMSEDIYNLQIFTRLLSLSGKCFPTKAVQATSILSKNIFLKNSLLRRCISGIVDLYSAARSGVSAGIVLRNSYFPKFIELRIALTSLVIWPKWRQVNPGEPHPVDMSKRGALKALNLGSSAFELCIANLIYFDMPQCFVEEFSAIGARAAKTYDLNAAAIFSANGWYYDEEFKRWAAQSSEQGVELLGTQHGGDYGSMAGFVTEDHETAILDRYFTWGWTKSGCFAEIIPMPATKLIGRRTVDAKLAQKDILWGTTSAPRYLVQSRFLPSNFQNYLDWQIRFAQALPEAIFAKVSLRPHYVNYGWNVAERLKAHFPKLRTTSWSTSLEKALHNCRIYVGDHLSTTFIEALVMNQPTILFWNPAVVKLRSEAQPYYEILKNIGILHDTPELAARALAEIYESVDAWWSEPSRQRGVAQFCHQFGRTAPDALSLWRSEFENALARGVDRLRE